MKLKKKNVAKEKKAAKEKRAAKEKNDGRKKMEVSQKDAHMMNEGTSKKKNVGTSKKNKEVHVLRDNKTLFSCIFHRGGEFFREETMFYRGGMETIVSDIEPEYMKAAVIRELVSTWGYDKNHFRIWGKICNEFVEVKEDHIADEISIAAVGGEEVAHIYVEHNVNDISVQSSGVMSI